MSNCRISLPLPAALAVLIWPIWLTKQPYWRLAKVKTRLDKRNSMKVSSGLRLAWKSKRRVMDEDEKRRVAYHEAAHVVNGRFVPQHRSSSQSLHYPAWPGRTLLHLAASHRRPLLDDPSRVGRQMQVLLAGTLAEEIIFKDISTGAQNRLERASAIWPAAWSWNSA